MAHIRESDGSHRGPPPASSLVVEPSGVEGQSQSTPNVLPRTGMTDAQESSAADRYVQVGARPLPAAPSGGPGRITPRQ